MSDKPLDKNMRIRDIQTWCEDKHDGNNGGIIIQWSSERGFGEYAIVKDNDGNIIVDTECDGKELVKQALCKLIDDGVMRD